MQPSLGTPAGRVEIALYDPRWPQEFERERKRLQIVFGAEAVAIEHIGSTAVPGLAAKPTLDLMVGLSALDHAEAYAPRLAPLGYQLRPDHPVPGRLHFACIAGGLRTHDLSLVEYGSRFWEQHLAFRDALRADTHLAGDYALLKRRLARQHPDDPAAYNAGKDEFIAKCLLLHRTQVSGQPGSVPQAAASGVIGLGIVIGVSIGAGLGKTIGNIGLGFGLGLALGIALGYALDRLVKTLMR